VPPHKDAALFQQAVSYTAAQTQFAPKLIEKDYFCSVVLEYLASTSPSLVFRGGTCLAKVHAGFYRLSEDLDFVIPAAADLNRTKRAELAKRVGEDVEALPGRIPALRIVGAWTGARNSTQYIAVLGYTSLLDEQQERIKIEVSLREPLLEAAVDALAQTILLDPVSGDALINQIASRCLSMREAYAEKYRAALTRREIAIRDFYDVDHACRKLGLPPDNAELVGLVRRKLAVPGTDPVNVSPGRLEVLRQQLESQLRPVLRNKDFTEFVLERAVDAVKQMAARATS